MNYFVDKSGTEPAYIQLYKQLRDDIINGVYSCGAKLPSKRLLAEETGTSTITTEHTFSLLCEEGYCEGRPRSGYIVTFSPDEAHFSHASDNFLSGSETKTHYDNPFPFSVYAKAARKVLTDYGESILSKSPYCGCAELRQAVSAYLAVSRGIKASPDRIIIGSGSEYLYGLLIEFFGRNTKYAIEDPSYEKIGQVYGLSGAEFEKLTLGKDGIDSDMLNNSRAQVLHVSPYRSYPSGVTASASKKHEYIRWAAKGERYLIEDDYESEFTVSKKHEETLFSLSDRDNVVYMNSFSMTVAPGMRMAYAVLPEKLLEKFSDTVGFYSCTVPTFDQLIMAELIRSGDFERHINRTRRNKRKSQDNVS